MYVLRVLSREEQMIEQFEEAYRAYMNRTGCIGPRFRGPPAPRAAAGRGLFDEILPRPCACTRPQPGPQMPSNGHGCGLQRSPLRPPKKRPTVQPCFAGCACASLENRETRRRLLPIPSVAGPRDKSAGGVFTGCAGRAGRPRREKTPALLYLLFLSATQHSVP